MSLRRRLPTAVSAVLKGSLVSFFLLHNPLLHLFPPAAIVLLVSGPAIAGAMLYDRVRLPWWGNVLAAAWIGVLNTLPYFAVAGLLWFSRGLFPDDASAAWVIAVVLYACLGYALFGAVVSLLGIYVRKWTTGSLDRMSAPVAPDTATERYQPSPAQ